MGHILNHILDHVLDHMIVGFITTVLQICKYINRLDKINKSASLQIILEAANYLIHFENYVISPQ